MKTYNGWAMYDSMPDGFRLDKSAGSPLNGYEFIINGSPLSGGARALLKVSQVVSERVEVRQAAKIERKEDKRTQEIDENYCKTVNDLARKKFEMRLLADIKIDLMVCEIEGWDKIEYITELKALINGLLK